MQIPISSIEAILQKLLSHARELGVETVKIPVDYYWDIADKDLYDMSLSKEEVGSSLGIGSLKYDWEIFSRELAQEPDESGYTSSDYLTIASILQAIGYYLYDSRGDATPPTETIGPPPSACA